MEKKCGRNDPCPCGSGLKYKKCCAAKSFFQKKQISVVTASNKIGGLFQGNAGHEGLKGRAITPVQLNSGQNEKEPQPVEEKKEGES